MGGKGLDFKSREKNIMFSGLFLNKNKNKKACLQWW